LNFSFWAFS